MTPREAPASSSPAGSCPQSPEPPLSPAHKKVLSYFGHLKKSLYPSTVSLKPLRIHLGEGAPGPQMTPDPTREGLSYAAVNSSNEPGTCGMWPGAGGGLALVAGLRCGEVCGELTLPLQGGGLTAALQVPAGGW